MNVGKLRLVHGAKPHKGDSPDSLALRRVASGDVGALGGVYDRHAVALLRFAARLSRGVDAEDLVQTTFIRAVQIAASYDARGDSARHWLFGILARVAQERRRSLARFARAVLRFGVGASGATATAEAHRSDLEQALLGLSDLKRVVIVLAEIEGFTCEEIARMLDVPIGTVWTRLHSARRELRAFYEKVSP